ncbi:hypothetical protein RRG08_040530 [Elysia crispata]|uniref:Uncharacterized protein n=1 Tax=Elysia crispata TaxID=231223 RepID=A0AAE0Z5B4_9GAST|nr:hypothetical protein RRG08_040530 [Elysia crispata]
MLVAGEEKKTTPSAGYRGSASRIGILRSRRTADGEAQRVVRKLKKKIQGFNFDLRAVKSVKSSHLWQEVPQRKSCSETNRDLQKLLCVMARGQSDRLFPIFFFTLSPVPWSVSCDPESHGARVLELHLRIT